MNDSDRFERKADEVIQETLENVDRQEIKAAREVLIQAKPRVQEALEVFASVRRERPLSEKERCEEARFVKLLHRIEALEQ